MFERNWFDSCVHFVQTPKYKTRLQSLTTAQRLFCVKAKLTGSPAVSEARLRYIAFFVSTVKGWHVSDETVNITVSVFTVRPEIPF